MIFSHVREPRSGERESRSGEREKPFFLSRRVRRFAALSRGEKSRKTSGTRVENGSALNKKFRYKRVSPSCISYLCGREMNIFDAVQSVASC